MNDIRRKTCYIISPHPDDETFACGGTIIHRLSQGYSVKIIVMTDGSRSHSSSFGIFSSPSEFELAEIRRKEACNAAMALGVKTEDITFLNVKDGGLNLVAKSIQDRITSIFINEKGAIREIFLPHENDYHKDHIATNKIIIESLSKIGLQVNLFFFKVYAPQLDQFNKAKSDQIITYDISAVLPIKAKAISCYESQIGIISSKQNKPVISDIMLKRFCTSHSEIFQVLLLKQN